MSYSIFILVLHTDEDIVIPSSTKIYVETMHFPHNYDRTSGDFPYMTMHKGTLVSLLNPNPDRRFLGAFDICTADFEHPEEHIKYPSWMQREETRNGLVPLVILNEYIKDFQEILQCLIDKSPIGKLMFLAQYQGDYEKVVCGTIPISEFFSLLAQKEILFNTYYILCK